MSFDAARAIFNTVDANRDGAIDRNEFNQWVAGAGGAGGAGANWGASSGSTVYESSASYGSGAYGAEALGGGFAGGAAYEAAAFDSAAAYGGGANATFVSGGGAGYGAGANATYVSGGGAGFGAGYGAGYGAGAAQTSSVYATDAQGLFQDPNPQIIRRPAASGVQTYTQNIKVRFLQPPPVPPPGPLIIKEVRPPQPPVPPPLRIRQQAPPLPTPPPLVLRERPPQPPQVQPSQTFIRRLAALPVPPRSVVIERLPPLPPRPRDIIIERWVPYGPQAKRRTIVQRAPPATPYPHPRNIIVQYEPSSVRVIRQFQRLGVTPANPAAYVQQYGIHLLDGTTLLQQARAAGVVEDISPPAVAAVGYSAAAYGQDVSAFGSSGWEGGYAADAGLSVGAVQDGSSFASYGGAVLDAGAGAGFGAGFSAGAGAGFGAGAGAGFGAGFESSSSYESGSVGGGWGSGVDVATAAFRAVDTNQDGFIDRDEFARFFQQGL